MRDALNLSNVDKILRVWMVLRIGAQIEANANISDVARPGKWY